MVVAVTHHGNEVLFRLLVSAIVQLGCSPVRFANAIEAFPAGGIEIQCPLVFRNLLLLQAAVKERLVQGG